VSSDNSRLAELFRKRAFYEKKQFQAFKGVYLSGFPVWQFLWVIVLLNGWLEVENISWKLVVPTIAVVLSTLWYFYEWKKVKNFSSKIVKVDKLIAEEVLSYNVHTTY